MNDTSTTSQQTESKVITYTTNIRRVILFVLAISLPLSLFGMQAAVGLGTIFIVIWSIIAKGRNLSKTPLDIGLAAFVVAIVISLILAPGGVSSWHLATAFWTMLGFYVAYFCLDSLSTLRLAVYGFISAACLAAAFAIYQTITGHYPLGELIHPGQPLLEPAPGFKQFYGAKGFFASRHAFSHMMVIPLGLLAGWIVEGGLKPKTRITLAAIWIFVFLGLAAAWSRVSPFAIVAASTALVLVSLPKGLYRRLGLSVFFLMLIAGYISISFLPKHLSNSFSGNRDWGRLGIWQTALELTDRQPLSGVGYGNFAQEAKEPFEKRRKEVGASRFKGVLDLAHSNLLSLMSQTGFLGLLAFCLIFVCYFRTCLLELKNLGPGFAWWRGYVRGAMTAVVAFLLIGLVHDNFFRGQATFSLYFVMATSLLVFPLIQNQKTPSAEKT